MARPAEAGSHWQALFYHSQLSFHTTIPVSIFISNFAQQSHIHNIMAFTIGALLAFHQIPSLLELHPIITRVSVIAILGYYLAFRARFWFPRYASQLTILMAVSGSFSVASLVSLLLPDSWWCVKCIIYLVLLLSEFHQIIRTLYDKYVRRRQRRQPPRRMTPTRQILPLTNRDIVDHANRCRLGRGQNQNNFLWDQIYTHI